MEEVYKILEQVDQVSTSLLEEKSYQDLQTIQEEIKKNEKVMQLILKVKECQKKVVKSGFKTSQEELEKVKQQLESIPLYQTYLETLDIVNERFRMVENRINQTINEIVEKSSC